MPTNQGMDRDMMAIMNEMTFSHRKGLSNFRDKFLKPKIPSALPNTKQNIYMKHWNGGVFGGNQQERLRKWLSS